MFVAKWKNRKGQVNVLDAQWADAGVLLREAAHRGELCCPHCDQELWLREGERRRRHFALILIVIIIDGCFVLFRDYDYEYDSLYSRD